MAKVTMTLMHIATKALILLSGLVLSLVSSSNLSAQAGFSQTEVLNVHHVALDWLACGGGGSGAYRRPPKPGHRHAQATTPTAVPPPPSSSDGGKSLPPVLTPGL
jgi:hypothetical protein